MTDFGKISGGKYSTLLKLVVGLAIFGWLGFAFVRSGYLSPKVPTGEQNQNVILRGNKGHMFVPPDQHVLLQISHTFTLQNSTTDPWNVEFVGSSCGCTKPSIKNPSLAPGESTELTVTIEAAGRRGHVIEYVELKTGSTANPKIYAFLEAEVRSHLSLLEVPAVTISVPMGGREKLDLQVVSEQKSEEVQTLPELVSNTTETFEARLSPPIISQSDNITRTVRCPLTVELIAPLVVTDADFSPRRQSIEVKCGPYQLKKDIVWRVDSPIETRPRTLFLKGANGQAVSRQLVLKADSEFSILSYQVSSDLLEVEVVTSVPNKSHVAHVTFRGDQFSTEPQRFETQNIHFETNHPKQKDVSVVVQYMAP